MRRNLLVIALCIIIVTTIGCRILEVKGKPSADFSNRTVTAEQGSSFSQRLTMEGKDTDYRNLKVHFRMPDGVTCPDTPKTETLEDGEEWIVTVSFHVASSVSSGTYTVFARGEWEEFNEDADGWEGNEGELTKFTLIVEEKTSDSSNGQEEDQSGISFSNPMILGISGVTVLALAAGIFFYYRSRQRTEVPRPQVLMPETEAAQIPEPSPKRYCKHCGAEITPETTYCGNCGKEIGG